MSSVPSSIEASPRREWAYYTEPDRATVAGLETAFRRKGLGEPVVYLHGDGLTRLWLPMLEQLSAGADVIAPEHPGYGDTPRPDWLRGFDDMVLHYNAFFDALDLDQVHLVGHSIGGWLAAELAVFYPRRFKSLTLITPSGLRLPGQRSADTFRLLADELLDARFNGRGAKYTEYFAQEEYPGDVVRTFNEDIVKALLAWNPRYDYKLDRRLANVTVPALVIGAEEDRIVNVNMVDRYAELLPVAEAVRVKGADGPSSHFLHVEQPAEVARLISNHVESNRGPA
ncbi:MAG TPA: alpha/beta fold hydrolase [Baekduia sp.]|nr:alpha/beta fold hydrolase [Baekduia sp.]